MGIDESDLTQAFRLIVSSVALITTTGPDGPHGCTGTAWAEDPRSPFVVTPLDRSGTTRKVIGEAGAFCANLLTTDQRELALRFARGGDRFAGTAYTLGALDLPVIDNVAVALECELEGTFEFGTYDLLVGRVRSVAIGEHERLLTFANRTFGSHRSLEAPDA